MVEVHSPWFFKDASRRMQIADHWKWIFLCYRRERQRYPDHHPVAYINEDHPSDTDFARFKVVLVK